jgi:hypothetical protein
MFHHRPQLSLPALVLLMTGTACLADVRVVDSPATTTRNNHYVGNREPLAPSNFSITP